jgi:hypothetical protein
MNSRTTCGLEPLAEVEGALLVVEVLHAPHPELGSLLLGLGEHFCARGRRGSRQRHKLLVTLRLSPPAKCKLQGRHEARRPCWHISRCNPAHCCLSDSMEGVRQMPSPRGVARHCAPWSPQHGPSVSNASTGFHLDPAARRAAGSGFLSAGCASTHCCPLGPRRPRPPTVRTAVQCMVSHLILEMGFCEETGRMLYRQRRGIFSSTGNKSASHSLGICADRKFLLFLPFVLQRNPLLCHTRLDTGGRSPEGKEERQRLLPKSEEVRISGR